MVGNDSLGTRRTVAAAAVAALLLLSVGGAGADDGAFETAMESRLRWQIHFPQRARASQLQNG